MKNGFLTILIILLSCLSSVLNAEIIELKNDKSKTIAASYLKGSLDTSPVLLLHGLLQTREFSTISRLATSLNESGYTVISPTLSLGLNNRNKSLDCEAIHTHSLESDADELKVWIDWLQKKTGKKVTLIGHSAGGPVILNYLSRFDTASINYSILISLSYYASGPSASETKLHAEKARRALQSNPRKIDQYALNYCKTYPTFASAFLSYYNWNTEKVSKVVGQFHEKISIVIGTADKRIDSEWRKHLNKKYNNVISIDGASHFFDKAYEFDLSDEIESLLTQHSK